MLKLRDEKAVKALGCGMNQNEMLLELAKMGHFDCFLLAGRYSLLDQTSLEELIPYCKENHISLILGGVFNSGILINPSPESYFDYSKLDENWAKNLSDSLVRIPKDFESADYCLNKAYKLRDSLILNHHNVNLTSLQEQKYFQNLCWEQLINRKLLSY